MSSPQRPVPAAPQPWAFPQPHRFAVGSMRGYAYHLPGQHIISVRVAVPLPLTHEPRNYEGVARILAGTLTEGTMTLDAMAFADQVERLGAAIAVHGVEQAILLDLDVPRRNLSAALDLLVSTLTQPALTTPEVEREVRRTLAALASMRAHPAHRAAMEFASVFYDPSDRLSRPLSGSHETVSQIDRTAVLDYRAALGPSGSTVVISGDLGQIDAPEVLGQAFSAWVDGPKRPAALQSSATLAADGHRIVVVDRPGSVQSELIIGCPGPDRSVAGGWASYPVLGYLMGGSPNSRLDSELRERRGYTYGIRSAFRPRASGGQFLTSGSVRSEVTGAAVAAALDILGSAREGFSPQETAAGVDYVVKTAPATYETADLVADEAISRALDGSDTEAVTQVLGDMVTLTAERITQAYRRYVHDEWTVIVVGEADSCVDELAALGRGPVSVVS